MKVTVHLIHIGDREERKRAIEVFLDVAETWTSFPGNVWGVTSKHIEALKRLAPQVQFETATKAHLTGQTMPVRTA